MSLPTTTSDPLIRKILKRLSFALTGKNQYASAFRVHNKQLRKLGELSFQLSLDFLTWQALRLQVSSNSSPTSNNIFDYAAGVHHKPFDLQTLPRMSKEEQWEVPISTCETIKTSCHVFLDRNTFINILLIDILNDAGYGRFKHSKRILVSKRAEVDMHCENVTDLRVRLLTGIIQNFSNNTADNGDLSISLTAKSSDKHDNNLFIGCITSNQGVKEEMTSAQIYEEYAMNMRMMFEHKYGARHIASHADWREKIRKLGHAAVTLQMLQNASHKCVSLASKHHVVKDAAFIIYNAARIDSILRRFSAAVDDKLHPELPEASAVDFSTLKHEEEWILIYCYLAQFPLVIEQIINGLSVGKLHLHRLFEFALYLAVTFSTYYSRVKILTEPNPYMVHVLHARIYLLKCVQRVLLNCLQLLNIEPVYQM